MLFYNIILLRRRMLFTKFSNKEVLFYVYENARLERLRNTISQNFQKVLEEIRSTHLMTQ